MPTSAGRCGPEMEKREHGQEGSEKIKGVAIEKNREKSFCVGSEKSWINESPAAMCRRTGIGGKKA